MFLAAAAANTDAAFLGSWVSVAFLIINGVAASLGVIALFATRREVSDLATRVKTNENDIDGIREKMEKNKDDLIRSADARSSVLHNRINPIVENTAAIKGQMEAFTESFRNLASILQNKK